MSTPSSYQRAAMAAPTSALFWWSAETTSMGTPLTAPPKSSTASCAARIEPCPVFSVCSPARSVRTPILMGLPLICAYAPWVIKQAITAATSPKRLIGASAKHRYRATSARIMTETSGWPAPATPSDAPPAPPGSEIPVPQSYHVSNRPRTILFPPQSSAGAPGQPSPGFRQIRLKDLGYKEAGKPVGRDRMGWRNRPMIRNAQQTTAHPGKEDAAFTSSRADNRSRQAGETPVRLEQL